MVSAASVQMGDGTCLRTWTTGTPDRSRPAVVMVNGGPGLPDYLAPVAEVIEDMCQVHRYDQRGTGGSPWEGDHTITGHLDDLVSLLDAWGHRQVVLVGHSFGTNLTSYFLLAHPERVAGLVHLAGPFLDPWREAYRATERARRSDLQQARLEQLEATDPRSEDEEIEFLALSWFTDHTDPERAWGWSIDSARRQRPINYVMNAQLNAAKKADPLEAHVPELRGRLPPGSVIIGGEHDSRPAAALRRLAHQLDCAVTLIPDAGHSPWLEAPDLFRSALRAAVDRALRHERAQ